MGVPELLRSLSITLGVRKMTIDVLEGLYADGLYFDLASLIHIAAQKTYAYGSYNDEVKQQQLSSHSDDELREMYHQTLFTMIEHAITTAKPRKLVYLAMDGVPVYAKTVQQRQRRFGATPSLLFDSNCITPGTKFLDDLADRIREWISVFSKTEASGGVDYFLSDHTVPGEGEHKIASQIRKQTQWTNIVHGLDTDLFLISLLIDSRVYLWNERQTDSAPQRPPGAIPDARANLRNPGQQFRDQASRRNDNNFPQIVDVDATKGLIIKRIGTPNALLSFVTALSILGNDFIPRNKSLEDFVSTMRIIIDVLRKNDIATVDPMTGDSRILWKAFLMFIVEVSTHENELVVAAAQRTKNTLASQATNGVVFDFAAYADSYRKMASRRDGPNIDEIVSRYLEMVAFVLLYYSKGTEAVNNRLYYDYYYSPLLTDLARAAPRVITGVAQRKIWVAGGDQFLNPYHHLIAVLPRRSFYLLPSTVSKTLNNKIKNDASWKNLYPENVERDIDGFAVEHVGAVFVPFLPPSIAESIKVPETIAPQAQLFKVDSLHDDEYVDDSYFGGGMMIEPPDNSVVDW